MHVEFRECNWADLWLWVEFAEPPVEGEKQYLEQVLDAWYSLGMLGGFNATSLVVQEAGLDISYMTYDVDASSQLPSLMHNMGNLEYEGTWARCWFDLGTADAISLDVLINALQRLSLEYVVLKRIVIGGSSNTWPEPSHDTANGARLH
ncbi:MAG: DUF3531 family protein [Cyanobacteria bacterium J06642_2]